jgi:hypothetical protein
MMLVPLMRPPTPWARRPNLFAAEWDQMALVFRFVISSQYSMLFPVSGSGAELAYQLGTLMTCSGALKSCARGVSGVSWDGSDFGSKFCGGWHGRCHPWTCSTEDGSKLVECNELGVAHRMKGGCWAWVLKGG